MCIHEDTVHKLPTVCMYVYIKLHYNTVCIPALFALFVSLLQSEFLCIDILLLFIVIKADSGASLKFLLAHWREVLAVLISSRTSNIQPFYSTEMQSWLPQGAPWWQSDTHVIQAVRESDTNIQERGRTWLERLGCLELWSCLAFFWENRAVHHAAEDPIRGDFLLSSCI